MESATLPPLSINSLPEARLWLKHLTQRKAVNPLEFFEPLPMQAAFKSDPARTKGAFGGNRAGKTMVGVSYVIEKCLAKNKQRWWMCAETDEVSINIQQRKVWEMLPKLSTRYCHYDEVNGFRNGKIVFKNGSIIRFKTYRQGREAFASDDMDGILNDEEPPYDIYREQRMRLIDRNGEMIFTMTALNGISEMISEIYDDHEVIKSEFAPILGQELPRIIEKNGMRFYTLWTAENPHINQARLAQEINLMTREEIKSRVYGVPTALSGRIYPQFNKDIHCVPWEFIPKTGVCLYHVLDPHDIKPWAMQWWAVHKTGSAYLVHEYPFGKNFNDMESDDKSYDEYVKTIKNIELELIRAFGRSVSVRIIDPNFGHKTVKLAERVDNSGLTTAVRELSKRGLRYHDAVDDVEEGHLQVRKWLSWAKNDAGEIIQQPKLYIFEECKNTINHLSKYSRKDNVAPDGDVKANVQLTQKFKDYADTTRYFVMHNPVYIPRDTVKQPFEESQRLY